MTTIAFQGQPGAYSQQAAYQFDLHAEVLACDSFASTLGALQTQQTDLAILPVENTLTGTIMDSFRLLRQAEHINVIAEIMLPIHHCLMADKNHERIDAAISHPQALEQCHQNLTALNITPKAFFDTAGGAKYIAESQTKNIAAVASELAAKLYDLKIIQRNIQDKIFNQTRFFVLADSRNIPKFAPDQVYKSNLIFAINDAHGALYKILRQFSDHNINLTKLESHPSHSAAWDYWFILECEGHLHSPTLSNILKVIKPLTKFIKPLGSY